MSARPEVSSDPEPRENLLENVNKKLPLGTRWLRLRTILFGNREKSEHLPQHLTTFANELDQVINFFTDPQTNFEDIKKYREGITQTQKIGRKELGVRTLHQSSYYKIHEIHAPIFQHDLPATLTILFEILAFSRLAEVNHHFRDKTYQVVPDAREGEEENWIVRLLEPTGKSPSLDLRIQRTRAFGGDIEDEADKQYLFVLEVGEAPGPQKEKADLLQVTSQLDPEEELERQQRARELETIMKSLDPETLQIGLKSIIEYSFPLSFRPVPEWVAMGGNWELNPGLVTEVLENLAHLYTIDPSTSRVGRTPTIFNSPTGEFRAIYREKEKGEKKICSLEFEVSSTMVTEVISPKLERIKTAFSQAVTSLITEFGNPDLDVQSSLDQVVRIAQNSEVLNTEIFIPEDQLRGLILELLWQTYIEKLQGEKYHETNHSV